MVFYVLLGIVCAWLAVLTFLLVKTSSHYKKLVSATQQGSLDKILESMLEQSGAHKKDIELLQKAVQELDTHRHGYMQKFGYVKFNPFNDRVGGDQSFVIALLDNNKNGFVKTYMYTREGMRVYVKPVKAGASDEYELSQEEKEAIQKAS